MKTGQIVTLKSGGPLMAVAEILRPSTTTEAKEAPEEVVDCVWYQGREFVHGKFPANSLECVPVPAFTAKSR
jgi:uncharacterized protein YodC (DUF2158 family)